MDNTLRFRVHSVVPGTQTAKVMFEGVEVESEIRNSIVEITWDGPQRDHGTLTLRFAGQDIPWAQDTFVQDGYVDVTFTKVDMTPVPAPMPAPEPMPAC